MSVESELADLAEVVRDQVAQGIARDLAIKLLASLVSQMVDHEQFAEMVDGHLRAIHAVEADGELDTDMNERIADHFSDLLATVPDGVAGSVS